MKRIRITAVFTAILMSMIFLAGCSLKPTALGGAKKAADKMSKVESLRGNVTIEYEGDISYGVLSGDIGITLDQDVESCSKTGVTHMSGTASASVMGMDAGIPVEIYLQGEEGKVTGYVSADGKNWISREQSVSTSEPNALLGLGIIKKILDKEIEAELLEEPETIGGKEAYVLHVTLRGEIVREIMRELLLSLGQDAAAADEADLTDVSVDAVMYVWKDTYQIAGIRMDCTSLGNVMIREIAGDNGIEVETKKFVISYTADEYDTVDDLQIPQEVIDSSQSGTASILENLLP